MHLNLVVKKVLMMMCLFRGTPCGLAQPLPSGPLNRGLAMEILQQLILGTYFTAFIAATLLDMFYILRGDYECKRKVVGMAQRESTFL